MRAHSRIRIFLTTSRWHETVVMLACFSPGISLPPFKSCVMPCVFSLSVQKHITYVYACLCIFPVSLSPAIQKHLSAVSQMVAKNIATRADYEVTRQAVSRKNPAEDGDWDRKVEMLRYVPRPLTRPFFIDERLPRCSSFCLSNMGQQGELCTGLILTAPGVGSRHSLRNRKPNESTTCT